MPDIPSLNGKNWMTKGLMFILIVIVLVAYALVQPRAGQSTTEETKLFERIARMEECIETLRPLPREMSGMKVAMDSVKTTVDKIEKKLDSHVDRESN